MDTRYSRENLHLLSVLLMIKYIDNADSSSCKNKEKGDKDQFRILVKLFGSGFKKIWR